ncbi:hypothetical protein BS78_06G196100 [Paspalum vaginatum]|nr:hypothetical protein BS78_06G196100 [Paspalum vaginatum]
MKGPSHSPALRRRRRCEKPRTFENSRRSSTTDPNSANEPHSNRESPNQDFGLQSCNQMRGAARFLVQSATKQIKPVNGPARLMTVTTPQRHGSEDSSSKSLVTKDENVEPLVAFSRPPPLPPVLGPLVMLSFLEMSSSDEESK